MAPHSSTLAWKIPWMEEPGRLLSMGSAQSRTRLKWLSSSSICITESLCSTPETNTTLLINYTHVNIKDVCSSEESSFNQTASWSWTSTSRIVKCKFMLFINYPFYSILLLEPQQTKITCPNWTEHLSLGFQSKYLTAHTTWANRTNQKSSGNDLRSACNDLYHPWISLRLLELLGLGGNMIGKWPKKQYYWNELDLNYFHC